LKLKRRNCLQGVIQVYLPVTALIELIVTSKRAKMKARDRQMVLCSSIEQYLDLLNCRLPCHWFVCHWIRIVSIVFWLVLPRTPLNSNNSSWVFCSSNHKILQRTNHNNGNSMPCSLQTVYGYFYIVKSMSSTLKGFETGLWCFALIQED